MNVPEHEYERLLHRSRLMDLAQDILLVLDPVGVVLDVNDAAAEIHGSSTDELLGRFVTDFVHPDSIDDILEMSGRMISEENDSTHRMQVRALGRDNTTIHLEIQISWSHSEQKFYVVERDVSEQVAHTAELERLSEELRAQSLTDTLTGVSNRFAFDQTMASIEEQDEDAWLAILDIDYFKAINDTYGHVVGDDLLRTIAGGLTSLREEGDLIARIGGDEFAVLIPATDELTLRRRIDQIEEAVSRLFVVDDGLRLDIHCSIGATRREDGETMANWLRRSDRAMYSNKAEHRQVA